MNGKTLLVIFLAFCSIVACEKNTEAVYPADSYYFTSFESSADTAGWYRIGLHNIVEDAPKVGGKYSVEISGGCVIPHAWYIFPPLREDGSFILKCWGKNLSNGGSVSLNTEDYSGHIYIPVSEADWTAYESEDTLHAIAGSTLVLELNSGGFLPSGMRVDQIGIYEVD